MLYRQFIRSPIRSQKNIKQSFSFIDGFGDETEDKTMKSSETKNTQADTSCCDLSMKHTEDENVDDSQFYSQTETQQVKRQISFNVYRTVDQYRKKLQNLLNEINISERNKIFLRILILDKQYQKDSKLQAYFNWALDQYRKIKEQQICSMQQNSADHKYQQCQFQQ